VETIEVSAPAKPTKGRASNRATKLFTIFLKDKGGTGASMIARFLAELHQQRKTGAYLVDGDGTTASLSKHFGLPRENADPTAANPANPVHTFSLHGTESDRDTIASLLEVDAPKMVMDLPATSLTVLRKIETEYQWTNMLGAHGWRATVVASITPGEESIFDLADAMAMFGERADYVAAVNMGLAEDRSDFEIWDTGETRPKFLAAGGVEIVFPRLKPRSVGKLQQRALTFAAGQTSPHLGIADRSRLAKWFADAQAAIAPAAERLGF
jgi:hypothetical protein